jgi:hypothetical protein
MADFSNVTPIRPPGPPAPPALPPKRKRVAKARSRISDDEVGYMLGVHQARVYEARAISVMIADALREVRARDIPQLERLIRAADAIDRILMPVAGLDSEEDLREQGKVERANYAISRL